MHFIKFMRTAAVLSLGLLMLGCGPQNPSQPRIPVTPAWALGHIVWEDEFNTRDSLFGLIDQYRQRDIPVDGVIIDSPWTTSYNDFNWDTERYPDPEEMTVRLREMGVHPILWLTGVVNTVSNDCPVDKSANYDEALSKGYTVNDGEPYQWWKGVGSHIDFTNPEAVQWWYGELDRIMKDGVYGFKVDQGENDLPDTLRTHIGTIPQREFRHYYYDAMYDYVQSRRPGTGIILARPYSHQGKGDFASPAKLSLGWCGDFTGEWESLQLQVDNVYRSAQDGYGAVGVEIGGYFGTPPGKEELVRYAQFAALTASMINGGAHGPFENHLAWWHGPDAEKAYRDAVFLHEMLVPYIFSTLVDSGVSGEPLLRRVDFQQESHLLGNDVFTKIITAPGGAVQFTLPREGRWVDWRTRERYAPGKEITRTYGLDEFPLFVREGSILPVALDGRKALLVTPGPAKTRARFHMPLSDDTSYADVRVSFDPRKGEIRLDADTPGPWWVVIQDVAAFDAVSGSSEERYDPETRQLWIGTEGKSGRIRIQGLAFDVIDR